MTKKQSVWLGLALTVLMAASPAVWAWHGKCGGDGYGMNGHGGGGGNFESKFFFKTTLALWHAEDLGISDSQKEDIQKLIFSVKKDLIKQNAEMEVLKLEIDQLMHAKPVDLEAVNKLIDQKYEIKKNKTKALAAAIVQFKQSLSDDQQAKMKALYGKGGKG